MFKKLLMVSTMALALGCSSSQPPTPVPPPAPTVEVKVPEKIVWHEADPSALSLAKAQKKGLLIFVTSETCKWCTLMKEKTFQDQEVIERVNPHFICVEVIAEKEPELAAALLDESIYPTTLFSLGEEVDGAFVAQGYLNSKVMLQVLDKMDDWRATQEALKEVLKNMTPANSQ